jgi:HK97 family phage major capsid protein
MAEVSEIAKKEIEEIAKNTASSEFDKKKQGLFDELKGHELMKDIQGKAEKVVTLEKGLSDSTTQVNELKDLIGKQQKQLDEISTRKNLETQQNMKKGFDTMEEALYDAFSTKQIQEQIDKIIKNGGKQEAPLFLEIRKAAVDLTVDNTIGAGDTQVTITQNTGVISAIRQRAEKYLAFASVGVLSGDRALWVEETDEQGTPVFLAEGSSATQLSVKYVEKTAEVRHIPVYGKVTTAMLADLPQLISYIQNNLIKRVGIVTENQLLTGNNTGENLNGIKTVATAFSAGGLANAVVSANEFDVLEAVALQVEIANGAPNAVFVHPSTLSKMKLIKDSTGVPLWKSYMDNAGGINVSGMQVVTTTGVTAGEYIGGDIKAANVLFREGLTVQIGLDGNDFIQNKKTILVQQKLVQFVSANDTPTIVKGTFASAKSLLDPAVTDA